MPEQELYLDDLEVLQNKHGETSDQNQDESEL